MKPRPNRSYFEIVWQQFRANRPAYWSMWLLLPIALVAIFAPVLASNLPFVYRDGNITLYPWFRGLFTVDEPVNYLFNMALLAFFPWLAILPIIRRRGKKKSLSPRKVLRRGLWWYAGMTILLAAIFSTPMFRLAPRYTARDFTTERWQEPVETKQGYYPPIPFGPIEQDILAIFKPPMYRKPLADWSKSNDHAPHILGTDNAGRDVLVQMIYGTRISMTVGFLAVGLYLSIGCVIGALLGYVGGRFDIIMSRVIEVVLLFPAFFLILTLVALLGPSIYIIMFVIGITGWPTIARLIRAEVLKQRSLDYVTAARACGASHARIIFRHLLPNSVGPALVAAPFGIAGAIMTEASLSLLGFGVQPPTPSWGTLLQLGSANYNYWWLVVVPSLAIFVIVTLFNLVGTGLRDAMDPKLRTGV